MEGLQPGCGAACGGGHRACAAPAAVACSEPVSYTHLTQAEIVCDKLHIPAISTGNILREAMKNETEMGVKAKALIDSGALVPDDVIIGIIKERLAQDDCKNGFIPVSYTHLDERSGREARAQNLEPLLYHFPGFCRPHVRCA